MKKAIFYASLFSDSARDGILYITTSTEIAVYLLLFLFLFASTILFTVLLILA